MKIIPYGRQAIQKKDLQSVRETLQSDWVTQGPKVKEFEQALAKYCGTRYAVAVSSGTAALHLACLAAGIKKGDRVITSPITFVASANCVLYCGGKPVFSDIQTDTGNIDPQEIKKKINRKTKAIIPVHFAGYPCNLEEIYKIAKRYNLIVIEDACHALGAEYNVNGRWLKIGSCKHSDMAVFSFHPVKAITTGEGGAITTNNRKVYEKLLLLKNHGITKERKKFLNPESLTLNSGNWYYEMQELGFNYRITDFQCALGLSQLRRVDRFIKKRRDIASRYNSAFKKLEDSVKLPTSHDRDKKHVWHLYILRLKLRKFKKSRKYIFEKLRSNNIGVQVHYIPVYKQPFYKQMGYSENGLNRTEEYYKECISLPIYVGMDVKTQKFVIETVKGVLYGCSVCS